MIRRITGSVFIAILAFIIPVRGQEIEYVNASFFDDGIRDIKISGNWAYGMARHSFQVYSISDIEHPRLAAGISFPGQLVMMDISGNYAYIANYNLGIHIIDISDPANPTQVNLIETNNPTAISVRGDYAYVANYYWNSLEIIDVSDIYNPSVIREFYLPNGSSRAEAIDVQGSHVFIADSTMGLQIINIQDPGSPFIESIIGIEYVPTSIFVYGEFAYVISYAGWGNSAFEIFNISDPASPYFSGSYLDPISRFTDISVLNNYAFITNSWEMFTMKIFDVSDPSNPTNSSTFIYGGWGAYSLSIDDTLACLGNMRPVTFTVLDISDFPFPFATGYCSATGNIRDIFVAGDYGYVASDEPSLISIYLPEPSTPEIMNSVDRIGLADKIFVLDNLLFLANNWHGLEIFDISYPGNLQSISQYITYTTVSVYVSGDYAYLAEYDHGIEILDISEPSTPVQAGVYNEYTGRFYDVKVIGDYAFVACGPYMGFQILEVSDPGNPVMIGGHVVSADARAVDVSGDYAFVAAGPTGLLIFDISDPTSPVQVSQFDTPDYAMDVVVEDNYVYVADTSNGLFLIDAQNPDSLILVNTYDSPGEMRNIHVEGDYIYAADKYSLLILYFDRETGIIKEVNEYPQNYSILNNYPNPFNSSTTIHYILPANSEVAIEIFDILGRKVETLTSGRQTAGPHFVVWNPENLTSGVYLYRITAGSYTETRKSTLLK